MSIVVTGRVDIDPDVMQKLFDERPDDFRAVMNEAKKRGAIHHEFLAADGAVTFRDEWDTAQHFQEFFTSQPIIADLLSSAGLTTPPRIDIYEVMPSPDRF